MNRGVNNCLFWGEFFKDGAKDNYKPEEIIPEKSYNCDHLSVHGPSTITGQCILKEKLKVLELSEYSPRGKTILEMSHKFVHCLEELSIRKGGVKQLYGLIQRCNLNMSSLKNKLQECIRIMLNL